MDWDVFISHAWEDKETFARPLAKALEAKGVRVWFDEFTLTVGDRLRRSIDDGLAHSRYGIVILSPHFFAKEWPQKELDGLAQRESGGQKVILPVWHNVTAEDVRKYSPTLADRIGVSSSRGLEQVVAELLQAMRWTGRAVEQHPVPLTITAPRAVEHAVSLTITAPILVEFVRVPAGEFLMGSDRAKDKGALDDEQPQHRLVLPEFHIGKYPITNAQYAVFVQATRHRVPEHWQKGAVPPGEEHHPVVNVSWFDAVAFCDWLSRSSGRTVRLPSEAEWEKAARGTTGQIYPWGDQPPDRERCNCKNWVGDTTPVGRYPKGASPYGALDMSSNVWEWCLTKWRENYWTPPDDDLGGSGLRVVRGGSFINYEGVVRCAYRLRGSPDLLGGVTGFRVVASPGNS